MTYIETYSGKKIDLLDPDPDQITLDDIFHALRNVPRFGGHTHKFYSVATHSLNVSLLVPDKLKFQALLHDATEAYIGNMPTPFKALLPDYKKAEARLWDAISMKFGLDFGLHPLVKQADHVALITERNYLKGPADWGQLENTLTVPDEAFCWDQVDKKLLLDIAEEYRQKKL